MNFDNQQRSELSPMFNGDAPALFNTYSPHPDDGYSPGLNGSPFPFDFPMDSPLPGNEAEPVREEAREAAPSSLVDEEPVVAPARDGMVRLTAEELAPEYSDDEVDPNEEQPAFRMPRYPHMWTATENPSFQPPWMDPDHRVYAVNLEARRWLRQTMTMLPITCKYVVPQFTPVTDNGHPSAEVLLRWVLEGLSEKDGDYRVLHNVAGERAVGMDAEVPDVTLCLYRGTSVYELPRYYVMRRAMEWIMAAEAPRHEMPPVLQPLINSLVLVSCHPLVQRLERIPEWVTGYALDPRAHLARFMEPCPEIVHTEQLVLLREVPRENMTKLTVVLFASMVLLYSTGLLTTERYMLTCMADLARRGTGPQAGREGFLPADGLGGRWVPEGGDETDGTQPATMTEVGRRLACNFWPFLLGRAEDPLLDVYMRIALIQTEWVRQEVERGGSATRTVTHMRELDVAMVHQLIDDDWGQDSFEITDIDRYGHDTVRSRQEVRTRTEARRRGIPFVDRPDGSFELVFTMPRMMRCQAEEALMARAELKQSRVQAGMYELFMPKALVDDHFHSMYALLDDKLRERLADGGGSPLFTQTFVMDPRYTVAVGPHFVFPLLRALALLDAVRPMRRKNGGVTSQMLASLGDVVAHAISKALESGRGVEGNGTHHDFVYRAEIMTLTAVLVQLGRVPTSSRRTQPQVNITNFQAVALTLRHIGNLLLCGAEGTPMETAAPALAAVLGFARHGAEDAGPVVNALLVWLELLISDAAPVYMHTEAVVALSCLVRVENGVEVIAPALRELIAPALEAANQERPVCVCLETPELVREMAYVWATGTMEDAEDEDEEDSEGGDNGVWKLRWEVLANVTRGPDPGLPTLTKPWSRYMHRESFVRAVGREVENWIPMHVVGNEPDALLRARLSECFCTPSTLMRGLCMLVEDTGVKNSTRDGQGKWVMVNTQKRGETPVGIADIDDPEHFSDTWKDPPFAVHMAVHSWENSTLVRPPPSVLISSSPSFIYTYTQVGSLIDTMLMPTLRESHAEMRRTAAAPAAAANSPLARQGRLVVRKRKRGRTVLALAEQTEAQAAREAAESAPMSSLDALGLQGGDQFTF